MNKYFCETFSKPTVFQRFKWTISVISSAYTTIDYNKNFEKYVNII